MNVMELAELRDEQRRRLVKLLAAYVSSDDSELSDDEFVKQVYDRYVDEIRYRHEMESED